MKDDLFTGNLDQLVMESFDLEAWLGEDNDQLAEEDLAQHWLSGVE